MPSYVPNEFLLLINEQHVTTAAMRAELVQYLEVHFQYTLATLFQTCEVFYSQPIFYNFISIFLFELFICIYLCYHHLYFILVHIFHCVPALPYILLANGQNYTVVDCFEAISFMLH